MGAAEALQDPNANASLLQRWVGSPSHLQNRTGEEHTSHAYPYLAVVDFLCGLVADVHEVAMERGAGVGHQCAHHHWMQHRL